VLSVTIALPAGQSHNDQPIQSDKPTKAHKTETNNPKKGTKSLSKEQKRYITYPVKFNHVSIATKEELSEFQDESSNIYDNIVAVDGNITDAVRHSGSNGNFG